MFLFTYPAIVVATDNRLIATNVGFHAVVTTTLGWAAAIRCAGGTVIDLSDWVDRGTARWSVASPALQRGLCDWTGHTAGQQGRKEAESVDGVKVHLGQ
jgi:hypothetical protein